jgi:hypothetical protein
VEQNEHSIKSDVLKIHLLYSTLFSKEVKVTLNTTSNSPNNVPHFRQTCRKFLKAFDEGVSLNWCIFLDIFFLYWLTNFKNTLSFGSWLCFLHQEAQSASKTSCVFNIFKLMPLITSPHWENSLLLVSLDTDVTFWPCSRYFFHLLIFLLTSNSTTRNFTAICMLVTSRVIIRNLL